MVDKADDLVYVNEISARFNERVHNDHGSTRLNTTYGKKAFMRFVNFLNVFYSYLFAYLFMPIFSMFLTVYFRVLEYGERRGAIMNSLNDNRRWRHETPNFEIQV